MVDNCPSNFAEFFQVYLRACISALPVAAVAVVYGCVLTLTLQLDTPLSLPSRHIILAAASHVMLQAVPSFVILQPISSVAIFIPAVNPCLSHLSRVD